MRSAPLSAPIAAGWLIAVAGALLGSACSEGGTASAKIHPVEVEIPLPGTPVGTAETVDPALPGSNTASVASVDTPPPDAPRYPSGAGRWQQRGVPSDVPRVYAKTRNVWIRGEPNFESQWIGFLWFGTSVELAKTEPVPGPGCRRWHAVKPRGYVCVDDERATLDANDPVLVELYPYGANGEAANPHPFYGESIGAERYVTLPTENSQAAREWDYRKRMLRIEEARAGQPRVDSLVGIDLTRAAEPPPVLPAFPSNLQQPHRTLIPRSSVAWMREAHFEGRDFLLTDDLTWVPKDRVKPYPEVTFRGVHLDGRVKLPLAFFRGADAVKYRRHGEELLDTGERYTRLSWVELTGETRVTQDDTFHATRDGFWVAASASALPVSRDKTPWGADVGKPDETTPPERGRATWLDVSVLGGWLVAYEGTRPVFATMISPGRGGIPARGRPALETSATPTGRFKITGKFVTATMIAPNDLAHSAVPWAQNFSGPHALHGAYWHDAWGEKKSGGCINLSPQDARFMFDWTEPQIPEGWFGVRWLPQKEASTTLLVGP
jgi:hypothetical protein